MRKTGGKRCSKPSSTSLNEQPALDGLTRLLTAFSPTRTKLLCVLLLRGGFRLQQTPGSHRKDHPVKSSLLRRGTACGLVLQPLYRLTLVTTFDWGPNYLQSRNNCDSRYSEEMMSIISAIIFKVSVQNTSFSVENRGNLFQTATKRVLTLQRIQ